MKDVDLVEPTSFLDHVWDALKESVKSVMKLWQNTEICLKPGFLLEPRKNFLSELQGNSMQKQCLLGFMTWKVMQRNVWKGIANLRIKLLNNYTKLQRHAMDINLREKKWVSWRNVHSLLTFFSENVCMCLLIWDLISHGLWTCSCSHKIDKGLWQTLGTFDLVHSSYKWIQAILLCQCRLGLFQDSDFARDLEDSKSTSWGVLCIFGSHTCMQTSWMCKKQTSVSHSSTEAEIISLDAGLRMDGVPALTLWDLEIKVFHSIPNQTNNTKAVREPRWNPSATAKSNVHNTISMKHANVNPTNIDNIPSNTKNSDSSAMLYVFEDNVAVIKMKITGRSPTMRHVSRTHRVALVWQD